MTRVFTQDMNKKIFSTFLTLAVLIMASPAVAATYTFKQDQNLRNNEDNYLVVQDNEFVRSKAEPQSLVFRTQGGSGSNYNRYTAVTDSDLGYVNSLDSSARYRCQFKDLAEYIYPEVPGRGYRILAFGISCVAL